MLQMFTNKNTGLFLEKPEIIKPKAVANQFCPNTTVVDSWPGNTMIDGRPLWPAFIGHTTLLDPLNSDVDPCEPHGSLPPGSFFPEFGRVLPVRLASMYLESLMMELTNFLCDRREARLPSVRRYMVAEIIRLRTRMGNPPIAPTIEYLRTIEDISLYGSAHPVWNDEAMEETLTNTSPSYVWFCLLYTSPSPRDS